MSLLETSIVCYVSVFFVDFKSPMTSPYLITVNSLVVCDIPPQPDGQEGDTVQGHQVSVSFNFALSSILMPCTRK